MSAAQNMQVNVVYRLAAILIAVHNHPIAVFRDTFAFSYFPGRKEQFSDEFAVLRLQVIHGCDMLLGNDQRMQGCLGIDVPEGQNVVRFVDDIGRDFPVNDFQEQIVGHLKLH